MSAEPARHVRFPLGRTVITPGALDAVATEALTRKVGARGLRIILEELMLDIMYQLPSLTNISECVITREVVENKVDPLTVLQKAG